MRALQVAGVPTATFWLDPGAPEALLVRELLPITSRLVFDTTACLHPQQLFDVERLATAAQPVPVADLGWLQARRAARACSPACSIRRSAARRSCTPRA